MRAAARSPAKFCDIIELYGRVPRTKTTEQMLGDGAAGVSVVGTRCADQRQPLPGRLGRPFEIRAAGVRP
jgi:hypothetical protein